MENWCTCNMMGEGGSMSPRLWICEKHGKTGMVAFYSLQKKIVEDQNISMDEAWDIMNNIFKKKNEEFKAQGKIYFDEDYLFDDICKELNYEKIS